MNFKKFIREHREAFTLAEVVIVMAILSIMMVAFAPVVTKKTTTTGDAFRTFIRTAGHEAIYYGTTSGHKGVYIGTNSTPFSATDAFYPKLVLMQNEYNDTSTGATTLSPAVAFLTQDSNGTYYGGQLLVAKEGTSSEPHDGTVILGGAGVQYSYSNTAGQVNIAKKNLTIVGGGACPGVDRRDVICIGANSGADTYADYGIYIGNKNTSLHTYTGDDVHIGDTTLSSMISTAVTAAMNGRNGSEGANEFTTDGVSDERLKNVGKPFIEGLDVINKINPVNFTYKRDENKYPHVGVIAQALKPIFPNAVQENKEGYLYIRTEDMFYAAINAIKELHQYFLGHDKKIQQLEARNAVLEQQNKELQELYTELAKRVERLDKKKTKNVNLTPMPDFEEEQAVETKEPAAEEVKTEE